MANEGTNSQHTGTRPIWVRALAALIITSLLYAVSPVLPAILLFVVLFVMLGRIF